MIGGCEVGCTLHSPRLPGLPSVGTAYCSRAAFAPPPKTRAISTQSTYSLPLALLQHASTTVPPRLLLVLLAATTPPYHRLTSRMRTAAWKDGFLSSQPATVPSPHHVSPLPIPYFPTNHWFHAPTSQPAASTANRTRRSGLGCRFCPNHIPIVRGDMRAALLWAPCTPSTSLA